MGLSVGTQMWKGGRVLPGLATGPMRATSVATSATTSATKCNMCGDGHGDWRDDEFDEAAEGGPIKALSPICDIHTSLSYRECAKCLTFLCGTYCMTCAPKGFGHIMRLYTTCRRGATRDKGGKQVLELIEIAQAILKTVGFCRPGLGVARHGYPAESHSRFKCRSSNPCSGNPFRGDFRVRKNGQGTTLPSPGPAD